MTASRAGRFLTRLLLAGAAAGGAYLVWTASLASPAPVDLLPSGAAAVVEARDAAGLARRLTGTRFAAAFAKSETRAWLERTEFVSAFDALRAEVKRITGVSPGRAIAFDLVGSDAAVGWYPPPGGAAPSPWIAGGRLSVRAWAAATAMRAARKAGLGSGLVAREEIAGRAVYSFAVDAGQSLHLLFVGRVAVASYDRSLIAKSARAAGDVNAAVTREPAWQAIRGALPARGELFGWVRNQGLLNAAAAAGRSGGASVGALLRAGTTVEIDIAADPASLLSGGQPAGTTLEPLPAVALLSQDPLFFLSSRDPVPLVLAELLLTRQRAAAVRGAPPAPEIAVGHGYAVAVTGTAAGSGLFPSPRGLVVIGMANDAAAGSALPLVFPSGARTAAAGGTLALSSRESFPLAGEFELWGAAIGPRLVFATDTGLIDALAAEAGTGANPVAAMAEPEWRVSALATMSIDKALPLLRRWSAPLSGLIAARWPAAPDVTRDLGLLAAIRNLRVAVGSDSRHDRAALTLNLHDLP